MQSIVGYFPVSEFFNSHRPLHSKRLRRHDECNGDVSLVHVQEVSNETNADEITGSNVLPKLPRLFGAVNYTTKACPHDSRICRNCTHGQRYDPENQVKIRPSQKCVY